MKHYHIWSATSPNKEYRNHIKSATSPNKEYRSQIRSATLPNKLCDITKINGLLHMVLFD